MTRTRVAWVWVAIAAMALCALPAAETADKNMKVDLVQDLHWTKSHFAMTNWFYNYKWKDPAAQIRLLKDTGLILDTVEPVLVVRHRAMDHALVLKDVFEIHGNCLKILLVTGSTVQLDHAFVIRQDLITFAVSNLDRWLIGECICH